MFQNSVNFNKILTRLLRKSSHSDKSSPSSREHSTCWSTTSQFGRVVQVAWRLSCQWGNWCQLRQLRVPWLLQCSLGAPAIQAPSNSWTMHRSHIPDRQQRHKRSPTKDRDRWQNQLWPLAHEACELQQLPVFTFPYSVAHTYEMYSKIIQT